MCLYTRVTLFLSRLLYLYTATLSFSEVCDTLKYFSELLLSTFFFSFISLVQIGLLSVTRGEQIAFLFFMLLTFPFCLFSQFISLIASLLYSLLLLHHLPFTLTQLYCYLHQLTNFMICSLLC